MHSFDLKTHFLPTDLTLAIYLSASVSRGKVGTGSRMSVFKDNIDDSLTRSLFEILFEVRLLHQKEQRLIIMVYMNEL